jgi:hypothetical protein
MRNRFAIQLPQNAHLAAQKPEQQGKDRAEQQAGHHRKIETAILSMQIDVAGKMPESQRRLLTDRKKQS